MPQSESDLLYRLLLRCSKLGARIFRNQVGQYRLARPNCVPCQKHGRIIRSGLCVGSSDLIGWTLVTVTPEMVGRRIAVFTAIECKTTDRRSKTTTEQAAFLRVVQQHGGLACVARSVEDAEALLVGAVHGARPITGTCDDETAGVD